MAQFLKVGEELINVALVTAVEITDEEVTLSLVDPNTETGMRFRSFRGAGVVSAFRQWLAQNTEDLGVTPDPAPSGADLASL